MISIDFTQYSDFSACPDWWRNFATVILRDETGDDGISSIINVRSRKNSDILDSELLKFGGKIIDDPTEGDICTLEFETEENFNEFKLFWIIRGQ